MDDSIVFAQWRQCALLWGHTGCTWQIWLNLRFIRLTWVHNPNGKSIGSAVFAQVMAECSYTYTMGTPFPKTCPFPWGIWTRIWFMIPWANPSPQSKRHLHQFTHFCTDDRWVSLYFTMGRPFPSKLPLPMGIWTPSNTWFPVRTRVLNTNSILIGSALFAGLTGVTDRHTTLLDV